MAETFDQSGYPSGQVLAPWTFSWGGLLHVDIAYPCSLTTRVALPTEMGTDGQRPLLITKGNPTSS
jgi:hypothetical protein